MKAKAIITIMVMLAGVWPAKADLVFESGHNIYDESYGNNAEVGVINDAILDVKGGSISGYLMSTDIATVNVFDGNINELWTRGNSIAKIHGGLIKWLVSDEDSLVYLYAHDVIYHPQAPAPGHPIYGNSAWIEGIFINNDIPFSFGVGPQGESYSHIEVVPEPMTLMLLGLGSLLVIGKKR
jgi:hypothetical protein